MAKGTKFADLRGKSDTELVDLAKTTSSQIFESRFQNYTNRLNDTSKVGKLRREMARILTIQTERRHHAAAPKAEG